MTHLIGAAPGHGNFPGDNWSPTLFSRELIRFNREASVAEAITNNRFEGDIKGKGSQLSILLEPELTVTPHVRGQKIIAQALSDEILTLNIDQANNAAFKVDSIEQLLSHIAWGTELEPQMVYQLTNELDKNVLALMSTEATNVTARLGSNASPLDVGHVGAQIKPSDYINRFRTALAENSTPEEGRWFLASPRFYEKLFQEDSALVDASFMGGDISMLQMSKFATAKPVHGFTLFQSNNIPDASTGTNEIVMAGHINSTSMVQALLNSKIQDLIDEHGIQYKSLHVFGRKVIQPENLLRGHVITA